MTTDPEELRIRFSAAFFSRLPVQVERCGWDAARLGAHQREALRRLLAHAIGRSPFHARRLAGVDPGVFELDQLRSLPVMTKTEMMAAFDDVVTDRRVTRDRVSAHLASTGDVPTLLDDRYFVVSSGGSSGLKGMYVYDWDAMVDLAARLTAYAGPPPPGPRTVAIVMAPTATHMTRLVTSLLGGEGLETIQIPVTAPWPELVARLEEARPDALYGYPRVLLRLAAEQEAGGLAIRPDRISSGAEALDPEVAERIQAAFGVPVIDSFGASEGVVGVKLPGQEAFTFATDLALLELVDEQNQPVPPGTPSDRVLVTNLSNTVQPLIRYVLEDRFVRVIGQEGHGRLVARVEGRASLELVYGEVRVHPLVVLGPVTGAPGVADYRIRQTAEGIDAELVVDGPVRPEALARELEAALERAGLDAPRVSIRIVERLERDPATGKLRRLVPLSKSKQPVP